MPKTDTQSRSWIMTQSAEKITYDDFIKAMSSYVYIGQEEEGKEKNEKGQGYRHYQIYIENPTPIRFSTLKAKLPNCHLEQRKGTRKEAYDYCTKPETRIGEIFGNGDINVHEEQGKRSDIIAIRQMIVDGATDEEILEAYPAQYFKYYKNVDMLRQLHIRSDSKEWKKIKVIYISGETRSGKTRYVMESHKPDEIYRTTDFEFGWIDGYRGEKILVLDEFRSSLKISELLDMTDGYIERIRGRNYPRQVCYDTVYIISNWKLSEQYPNIQKDKPADWQAFLARIDEVYEFDKNGVKKEIKLKEEKYSQTGMVLVPVDDDELPF